MSINRTPQNYHFFDVTPKRSIGDRDERIWEGWKRLRRWRVEGRMEGVEERRRVEGRMEEVEGRRRVEGRMEEVEGRRRVGRMEGE